MCKSKPGPRCSGHVGKQRDAVQAELAQVAARMDAAAGTVPVDHETMSALQQRKVELFRKSQALDAEWDETPAGQAELAEQIQQARTEQEQASAEADRFAAVKDWDEATAARGRAAKAMYLADALAERERAGALRNAAKAEALACKEAGDLDGMNVTLRHGPGSSWLTQSSLKDLALGRGRPGEMIAVVPGRAVALLDRVDDQGSGPEDWDDDDGARPETVTRGTVVVEQPVVVQVEDSFVVGGHSLSPDPSLIAFQGHGDMIVEVRPRGTEINESPADYADRYCDDIEDMIGADRERPADIDWDDAHVVRDSAGKPVLMRTEGTLQAFGLDAPRPLYAIGGQPA